MAILFWLIILLACIFAEIHTQAFVAIFIGVGAVVAFFLALASVPFAVQAVVWLLVSGVTLLALRPSVVHRYARSAVVDLSIPASSTFTNLTGFVEEEVGDEGHPGRVKIKGESWKAVSESGTPIPDGVRVVVKKTYGTTLWVEKA